jgi:hypothetical protein
VEALKKEGIVDIALSSTCATPALRPALDHVRLPFPALVGGTDQVYLPDVGDGGLVITGTADFFDCGKQSIP